jgi:hypothetical protein
MKLLTNKWLWISFLGLLLFAIFFDIFFITLAFKNLAALDWNPLILIIAFSSSLSGAIGSRRKIKLLKRIGLLFFVIAIFMTVRDFGVKEGLLLGFGMMILGKVIKWLMPKT